MTRLVETSLATVALATGGLLSLPALSATDTGEPDHRITAITLSSGGLAEIHREARITGTDTLHVAVPLEQVDDILKSLLVHDPDGHVTAVSLDGLSPVEETFRRLPFTPEQLGFLPTLAATLQGVSVRAESGGRSVEGTVLGVGEKRSGPEDMPRTEHQLSVITEDGHIEVLTLGSDTVFEILDATMREQVQEAVAVSGRGRTDRLRSLAIALDGEGTRTVGLSYVAPAPVWKTAYRLVAEADGNARLQAWAVVENATGADWDRVSLTLSSGNPVTLRQRLHQRYWHERPELPVYTGSTTPPRPDDTAAVPVPPADKDDAPALSRQRLEAAEMTGAAPRTLELATPTDEAVAEEGDTAATYRLPVSVTLAAGQTLSVPFIDARVPAERVSVFQPDQQDTVHPVAAVMLNNTTGTSLPPGILTVFDAGDGYVGDAELRSIPAGESRMASFAADRKVEISSERTPEESVSRVRIVDGTLHATHRSRLRTTYTIKGAGDAPRTVIIEHPRRQGWQLSSDALDSATPSHHRLRVEIEAGGTTELEAVAERHREERFALVDADSDALFRWSGAAADPETAAQLAELAELRQQLAQSEKAVSDIERNIARVVENQARIRANLESVPGDSTLGRRYLSMLEDEENRIADLEKDRATAEEELKARRDGVSEFIKKL